MKYLSQILSVKDEARMQEIQINTPNKQYYTITATEISHWEIIVL